MLFRSVPHHGQLAVLEAVGPVQFTSIRAFAARGIDQTFTVLRPQSPLTAEQQAAMVKVAQAWLRPPVAYDKRFLWNDNELYCSELVWKLYQRALHIELVPLARFRSFRLDDPKVRRLIEARFPRGQLPLDEPVVAPSGLLASPHLRNLGEFRLPTGGANGSAPRR